MEPAGPRRPQLAGREDPPDRNLLLAIQEVRWTIEPAAAALAAQRSTRNDRWPINAALGTMETAKDQASAVAADKAFHLAILDATHNPVLQGFRGAIDTILGTVFHVAVGSVGWFKENLPNHAAAARAIESGDPEKARIAMEQVLGYTKFKLSQKKAGAAAPRMLLPAAQPRICAAPMRVSAGNESVTRPRICADTSSRHAIP